MNKKLTIGMLILILLLISGCTNKELDTAQEQLTNEILQLKNLIAEKDAKWKVLQILCNS